MREPGMKGQNHLDVTSLADPPALAIIRAQLEQATAAQKCWSCGCFHTAAQVLEKSEPLAARLTSLLENARNTMKPQRYECLGCEVCWPAVALDVATHLDPALVGGGLCPTEKPEVREGWPPLPGSYTILRYRAPVAVCTLTNHDLAAQIAQAASPELALVGTLQTENLGIERLIQNILANPYIRFLVVCGADSRQAIGHLPGQSLVALARWGLDDHGRIIGAHGKRPIIRNISWKMVEQFRQSVEVIDRIGTGELPVLSEAVRDCANRNPGPAERAMCEQSVVPLAGDVPERMVSDPAGYFVVYVDRIQQRLVLEHYQNDGLLDAIIEGHTAAELYHPAIDQELISRLDHAAYLGRELARAEQALRSGEAYVQDAAPMRTPSPVSAPVSGCPSSLAGKDSSPSSGARRGCCSSS